MSGETQSQQAVYSSSQIADLLQVQESTLRKYCLILQEQGYEFLKNEHGHRAFFDDDIIVLRKFLELKSKSDMTLNDAAKSVVSWKNDSDVTDVATQDMRYVERYSDLIREFEDFKKQQMDFNKELIDEIKKQQQYIYNHLERRDQALMLALKESMEVKKEIAAAQKEKRKSWWQFWKQ